MSAKEVEGYRETVKGGHTLLQHGTHTHNRLTTVVPGLPG